MMKKALPHAKRRGVLEPAQKIQSAPPNKTAFDLRITPADGGFRICAADDGVSADFVFRPGEMRDYNAFCREQDAFAEELKAAGFHPGMRRYIWKILLRDHYESCLRVIAAAEHTHLHILGQTFFIPPRVREGEYEYYAIDDRDGTLWYVVEALLPGTNKDGVRTISKTPASLEEIKKNLPGIIPDGVDEAELLARIREKAR